MKQSSGQGNQGAGLLRPFGIRKENKSKDGWQ